MDEPNFTAAYDPSAHHWTAVWKWAEGKEPGVLQNQAAENTVPQDARTLYEKELQWWICDVQRNKSTVRPVIDFSELNTHVDAFTTDSDVFSDKLRIWRR